MGLIRAPSIFYGPLAAPPAGRAGVPLIDNGVSSDGEWGSDRHLHLSLTIEPLRLVGRGSHCEMTGRHDHHLWAIRAIPKSFACQFGEEGVLETGGEGVEHRNVGCVLSSVPGFGGLAQPSLGERWHGRLRVFKYTSPNALKARYGSCRIATRTRRGTLRNSSQPPCQA